MTHSGGQAHRVGYHGQKFMIVVTETYEGQHRDRVIAWSDRPACPADLAKLETDSGIESTSISGNCLKQDFDTVFNLMLDFIQSPAFREEKIDLVRHHLAIDGDAGLQVDQPCRARPPGHVDDQSLGVRVEGLVGEAWHVAAIAANLREQLCPRGILAAPREGEEPDEVDRQLAIVGREFHGDLDPHLRHKRSERKLLERRVARLAAEPADPAVR